MKKLSILLAVIILAGVRSWAVNVDELLLDHLVEKGMVSAEAAAAIRADAAMKTQDEKAAMTSFPLNGQTKINASGCLQVLYSNDESASAYDYFKVRRARLDFKGDVSRQVGWELQIDAVQTLKTVAGTNVVSRPVILDALINYNLNPTLAVTTGQFKIPFGRENLASDGSLDTIDRAPVTEKLVPGRDNSSQGRDFGVQLAGSLDFGRDDKVLDYAVGCFNGSGLYYDEENRKKDLAGRLVYYPLKELTLGVDIYSGKSGTTEADKLRTGLEFSWTAGKYFLKSEYITGRDGTTDKSGWYALAGAKLNPAVDLVARFDDYDPNTSAVNDRTDMTTWGLNWYLSKWARIQANYEIKSEEGAQINNNVTLIQAQVQF
jgi:phosphate-selective porin